MRQTLISTRLCCILCVTLLATISLTCIESQARAKYLFKVGTLAPDGSVWSEQFKAFSDDVKKQTKGEVAFRIYGGGIMGDDQAMYRKMRVGQLQGGGLTMSGISNIVTDFRVLGIPFLFESYEEIDYVTSNMTPLFAQKFAEQGMKFLSFTEVGFVYPMSKTPINTIDDLKHAKNWCPTGDPLSSSFMNTMGATPIQLSLPDVLSSLQTGLVDTVYNSLYGSIVLQWFTSVNYVSTVPYGYAYGAILLDGKAFNKLPQEYQQIVTTTADKYFPALNQDTRRNNLSSRAVLEEKGLEFVTPTPETVSELKAHQKTLVREVKGVLFSEEIYNTLTTLLDEYRNGATK